MSLSNSVRTHLIDPEIHNSQRTRFRLPDAFLASTLKLIDIGVFVSQQTDETGIFYPAINGVLGTIRRITLFSNDFKLDTVEELRAYAAIQNLKTTNQGSEDINRFELLSGINLSIASNTDGKAPSPPSADAVRAGSFTLNRKNKDYANHYEDSDQSTEAYNLLNNQFKVSSTETAQSGTLLLSQYLEFLRSVPVLPMIPNLQLEIEWNYPASVLPQDPDAPVDIANPTINNIRPTLVCDEILGVNPAMANTKLPYFTTLVERFVVPATANGVAQSTSFRSQTFAGRYLKDLAFFNQVTTDDGWRMAAERSPAMFKEKMQLVVNGNKYLPDQGISTPAMKQQYFNDTFAPLNIPYGALVQGLTDTYGNVISKTDRDTQSFSSAAVVHNFSVTGVSIESTIDRLDIEYQRTGNNLLGSTRARVDNVSQFNLLAFGRVAKQLTLQNGKITDSY
jgi:hypothetical protein